MADFAMVYIAEAHASDEWPIRSARSNRGRGPVNVKQPRHSKERLAHAQRLVRDFDLSDRDMAGMELLPLLVDSLEEGEPFETTFAPWPLRFFILSEDEEQEEERGKRDYAKDNGDNNDDDDDDDDDGNAGPQLRLRFKAAPSNGVYDMSTVVTWLEENTNPAAPDASRFAERKVEQTLSSTARAL